MPRAADERRAPDLNGAKALTPAQERVLVEALRAHPTPLRNPNPRVAAALVSAGVFRRAGSDAEASFALTPLGIDIAARLSAQSVIDAVNTRRAGGNTAGGEARRNTPACEPAF